MTWDNQPNKLQKKNLVCGWERAFLAGVFHHYKMPGLTLAPFFSLFSSYLETFVFTRQKWTFRVIPIQMITDFCIQYYQICLPYSIFACSCFLPLCLTKSTPLTWTNLVSTILRLSIDSAASWGNNLHILITLIPPISQQKSWWSWDKA